MVVRRCFREGCRRRSSHDITYTSVQMRDAGLARVWARQGLPVMVPGVYRVVRGEHGCRSHIEGWADLLNDRRRKRQA